MQYFTSDYHFNHSDCCNRPFSTIEEMDNMIISNHNEIVNPTDIVIFAGDFCLCNHNAFNGFLKRLNGRYVMIRGNHDPRWVSTISNLVMRYGGRKLFITHKPDNYNSTYFVNLVGHVHNRWLAKVIYNFGRTYKKCILINIGIDQWNFKPITINVINKLVALEDKNILCDKMNLIKIKKEDFDIYIRK